MSSYAAFLCAFHVFTSSGVPSVSRGSFGIVGRFWGSKT